MKKNEENTKSCPDGYVDKKNLKSSYTRSYKRYPHKKTMVFFDFREKNKQLFC